MSDDWYTPDYIFQALGLVFDLDVAAPVSGPRYTPAHSWFSSNGELMKWYGLVWMNPPFGTAKNKEIWINKFFLHGNGVALLPDTTSARWWQAAARKCDGLVFVSPRVRFERPGGVVGTNPASGTTLFAAGDTAKHALQGCGLGVYLEHKP